MHKKLLLISHNALSFQSNNGKTLSSMFKDWPSANFAHLYLSNELPESNTFSNFFKLNDFDVISFLLHFKLQNCCGEVYKHTISDSSGRNKLEPSTNSKVKNLLLKTARRNGLLKLLIRNILYGNSNWCSKNLIEWIDSFRPDLIFFVGGDAVFSFKIASYLSRKYEVPLHIYITDDYVISADRNSFLKRYIHNQLLKTYRAHFAIAREVFVIGDEMSFAFEKLFSRKFFPIMNSIEFPKEFVVRRRNFNIPNYSIDVVYAGGLHLNRGGSLMKVASLFKQVSASLLVSIKLSVYTVDSPDHETIERFKLEGIVFCGGLDAAKLSDRLKVADFLLHVESIEPAERRKTRYSVSTKIPEYLASGVCIIAFGPAEAASIRLIKNNGIGLALTDCDDEASMQAKLQDLVDNPIKRADIALLGGSFAASRFNGKQVREMLFSILHR